MRLLTPSELIAFCQPDPALLAKAEAAFQKIIDAHGSPKHYLAWAVQEGVLQVRLISCQGQPAFVIWYQVTPDGRFWVDCAQSVCERPATDVLFTGCEMLAREHNCQAVEFRTLRRGLVHQAAAHGYVPTSVTLTKFL